MFFDFSTFQPLLQLHLKSLLQKGQLYQVDLGSGIDSPILLSNGEKLLTNGLWELYINAFDEEDRQLHRCWCCHQFIKYYGGLVYIDPETLEVTSIWDFEVPNVKMGEILGLMSSFVKGRKIISPWADTNTEFGTAKSVVDVIKFPHKLPLYYHWYAKVDSLYTNYHQRPTTLISEKVGQFSANFSALKGYTLEALDEAIEAAQGRDLPRSDQFLPLLLSFKQTKEKFISLSEREQELFAWVVTAQSPKPFSSTLIGTFVKNLSEGMSYDVAHRKLASMEVGYQRPKGACSPTDIRKLKDALSSQGLMPSLQRRILGLTELDPNYLLFSRNPKEKDIFDRLEADTQVVNSKALKAQEVKLVDFLEPGFLSGANTLEFLFENKHKPMLFSLIGGNKDHKPLTYWSNNITWAFRDGNATAIAERVKAAGGVVDAPFRASLAWHSHCDLDIHAQAGQEHIYFVDKVGSFLTLDIDMNAGKLTNEPVENIYGQIPGNFTGKIQIWVNNYCRRSNNQSFELELKLGDELLTFTSTRSLNTGQKILVLTLEYQQGKLVNTAYQLPYTQGSTSKQEVWGLSTGSWIPVLAMTPSPNYWQDEGSGNKFLFLYLQNCVWGEKDLPRGIFNEMISFELKRNHKQALEALGNLIEVSTDISDQASGVAFNTSTRTNFYVRVNGHIIYQVIC